MIFSDDVSLSEAITSRLVIAVRYMMDAILTENDNTILDVVYASYAPSSYERTGQFQEAWDATASGGGKHAEGEFFFSPDAMAVSTGMGSHLAQHASQATGASVVEYMADILYEGAMGCIFRPTNRDAWKVLDKWLTNTKFRQIFEAGLNQSGLPWKRSIGGVEKITED